MEDSLGKIKEMDAAFESLKAALLSATQVVVDNFSKVAGGLDPDVVQAFKDLGENIEQSTDQFKNLVTKLKEVGETLEKQKTAKPASSGKAERSEGTDKGMINLLSKILGTNRQQAKHFKGLAVGTASISPESRRERNAAAALSPKSGGDGGRGGRGRGVGSVDDPDPPKPPDPSKYDKYGKDMAKYVNKGFLDDFGKKSAKFAMGVSNMISGGEGNIMQQIFAGSVADATEFGQEMREIAFQTQGVTGDFKDMQKEFANLGSSVVSETGKSVDALNKAVISNSKKGFKNQKEGQKVLKSGLHLSTMIGSETQQTADLFGDWHRTLGMSANQMSDLSRSMRDVALSTGVTGDELLGAMKSSEGILKNMRNQGTLTSSAARSTIEMVAEFKKTGFDENTKFVEAMSSYSGRVNADQKTKTNIADIVNRIGGDAPERMLYGEFGKSRKDQRAFSGGVKDMAAEVVGRGKDKGKDFDFKKMSQKERRDLAVFAEARGTSIAGLENLAATYEKSGKGLGGTLDDLDKQANSKFGTEEEKKKALQQKDQAIMGAGQGALSSLREKSSGDISLKDAMKNVYKSDDFANSKEDMSSAMINMASQSAEMAKKFGLSGTKEQMATQVAGMGDQKFFENSMVASVENLMKAQKEKGMDVGDYSGMLKALKTGDTKTFNEMYDNFDKDQKKLAIQTEADTDPQKKLNLSILQFNENVRKFISGYVTAGMALLGGMGLLGIQLALNSAALWATLGSPIKGMGAWLARLGGMATPAAGAAATGAGAAGAGAARRVRPGGIKGLLKSTEKFGNAMRTKIVWALEDIGKNGSKIFRSMGLGIRRSFWAVSKGFKDSRAAGQGYFKAMGKGALKGYGSIYSSIGRSNKFTKPFTNAFIRGFSRATKSGDKFFKAFGRGFSGMMKSSDATRKIFDFFANSLSSARKSLPMLDAFIKGFSRSTAAGNGFFKGLTRGFSGAMKSNQILRSFSSLENFSQLVSNVFGRISKAISSLVARGGSLVKWFWNFDTNIFKVFEGLRKLPSSIGSIGKGLGSNITKVFTGAKSVLTGGFKGGIMAASKGARAAILGGTMGTAQIVFSAIDAVFGAVTGFQNTGKTFSGVMKAMGKETKDVTWGMYAASTISGALVGILDGLTFGMLRLSGVAEWLETFLSLTLYGAFVFFEGVLQSLYEVFKPVGRAFLYIGQQFKGIGDSFLKVFNSIASIFGAEASDMGAAFAMLYPIFKQIGRVIGWIVGVPIGAILWVAVKAISAMVMVIEIMANIVAAAVKWIVSFGKAIWSLLTLDLSSFWKHIEGMGSAFLDAVTGIFKPIVNFIWSIVGDIISPFVWLGNMLIWNSIIPDICYGIVGAFVGMAKTVLLGLGKLVFNVAKFFLKLPFRIMMGLGKFGFNVAKFFLKLPFRIMKGLFNAFVKSPIKMLGRFIKGAGKIWQKLSPYADDFFSMFKKNLYDYVVIAMRSWKGLLDYISFGWFSKILGWLKGFGKWIDDYMWKPLKSLGGKVLKWADDYIVTPLRALGSKIAQLADDWLVKPISSAIQTISQKFSDYLFTPITNFMKRIGMLKDTAKTAGKVAAAGAKPATSAADDAAKAAGKAAQKGGWLRKMFGQTDEAAKAANPFAKMGGGMGKAARASAKAAASGASLVDDAAKAANPFASMGGGMGKAAKTTMAKQGPSMWSRLFGKPAAGGATAKAGTLAGSADDAAKTVLSSADDIAKAAPKALGFLAKSSRFIGVAAKKLPVVGPLLDFGIRKMTGESTGKAATGAAGGLAGGLVGAAAGAAIGSVVPVIGTAIGGLIGGIAGSLGGGWLADSIYDNIGGALDAVGGGLKSTFIDFPMWVGGKVKDGFNTVGSWIGEKAYEAAGGAVDWALQKSKDLSDYMGKMLDPSAWGAWLGGLYDGMKSSLGGIWSWMKSWIPGLGGLEDAAAGFKETSAEQAKTMGEKGPSSAHAVGSLYGAGANLMQGNVWEAGSKAGMAVQETGMAAVDNAKIIGGAVKQGLSSAWGGLQSMFGYGEQQVEQGKAMEKTMEMGQNPGSIYVHDTHTEKVLEGVLKDLEAVKSLADPSKYANEFMGIVAKVQQEGLQTNDIIAKANASIAPVLPTAIDASAWDPIKSLERNPEFIKAMSGLENDIINAGGGELIPSATSTSGLEDFLLKTQVGLENKAATLTTPVGHHAVPMLRPEGESDVGAVQPVHLEGITNSILRNKAGTQSDTGKLPVKELAGIEEASNEQVDQLILVKDAINKLVNLMTPKGSVVDGGGGSGPGNTRDPRTPMQASLFGNSRYGRVGDSANRSLVNNGRC